MVPQQREKNTRQTSLTRCYSGTTLRCLFKIIFPVLRQIKVLGKDSLWLFSAFFFWELSAFWWKTDPVVHVAILLNTVKYYKCLGKQYLSKSFCIWTCALCSWFNFKIRQWQILVVFWELLFPLPAIKNWVRLEHDDDSYVQLIFSYMCGLFSHICVVFQGESPWNLSKKYVQFCETFRRKCQKLFKCSHRRQNETDSWSQMGLSRISEPDSVCLCVSLHVKEYCLRNTFLIVPCFTDKRLASRNVARNTGLS